jgi:signal transduction histidine kinase
VSSLRRALLLIAAAGIAAGLIAGAFVMTSEHAREDRLVNMTLGPLVGWSFIAAGLIAWWRRPQNRVGALMTLVGFTWFVAALANSDEPAIFIVGGMLGSLQFGVLIHLLLAFPSGRVEGRAARLLVLLAYFDVGVVLPASAFFVQTANNPDLRCEGCPSNPLLISDDETIAGVMLGIYAVIAVVGLLGVTVVLLRRWRATPQRQIAGPFYLAGGATMVLTALVFAADLFDHTVAAVINIVSVVGLASVPFAFLAGLLRSRLARAGAITEIVQAEGRDLRETLADALDDPTLELAYWLPDRGLYVDRDGRPIELPEPGGRRAATQIERDGHCVAAIVHDAALAEERKLVEAAGSAAALALENERLDAELAARVEELQASRARIVNVGLAERRRIERDLHDGAQQRLVALRLQLRLARDQIPKNPDAATQMLDDASGELDAALAELRELARGIHPALLADRGLEPALAALARRAPLPVDVTATPEERLPGPVEAAAYFVVAEALTNVAKYAEASHASVAVERRNGRALVEVRDDGVGGADIAAGTGLSGLADRVAALDGRLEVDSPAGAGTVVRAEIPCG